MKRFITEYANYKIDEILKNELITEEAKQKAINKIDKAHFYCNKQMITIDEAIKMILNAFESEFKGEFIMECNKRDKIKKIILDDCGGKFSPQELLEKVVDNIYEKLKEIPNDYNELLSAYIRL